MTVCQNSSSMQIFPVASKKIMVDFSGGNVTSDAGTLLLGAIDRKLGLTQSLANCLQERRQPGKIRQSILDLFRERVFLIASGYQDCNDADSLKNDPLFKILLERLPQTGKNLASQPTLSRFENSVCWKEIYRISEAFLTLFIQRHQNHPPSRIILDADSTDDPTYGQQEFSFYHGYYETHCYLPLLFFARVDTQPGQEFLAAVLRRGNAHGGFACLQILKRIVGRLRRAFPGLEIIFRGDSAFALPEIYQWCEEKKVDFLIGFPKNERLLEIVAPYLYDAQAEYEETGEKVRRFYDFNYAAKSWNRERRIVFKAEVMGRGENPRFVVTGSRESDPEKLYDLYVERGDAENRIKELKLDLNSGRTSCHGFRANQFRLLLHAAAYVLIQELQRLLSGSELGQAQASTIRLRLFKIGALVKETVRRLWVRMASGFPLQELFWGLVGKLRGSPA